MTAQEQMKKMLDELMGTKRDGESIEDGTKFTDPGVCKSFIMGLCPFELFHNTVTKKLDLGPCHKYHSLALKADFELASKNRDYGYDVDQLDHLTAFVRDCDRKVDVNKKRLEDNNDEHDTSTEATSVHALNEQIGKMLAESETLGADGKVEESLAMMKEVEELKSQKRKAEDLYRNSLPVAATQQQKLRVCDICGAYLSLYDNDRRLADHFGGKLHMGFIKIRERLAELQVSVATKRDSREKEREMRRKERTEELEKEKSAEKSREKEKEKRRRSRSRSREGSRRGERSRDRRRERSRSRDRDRRRRDGDRYRDRRSDSNRDKYRSRDRSRSGDRRRERNRNESREASRNRSRERSRNRSRDRSRERSRHGSRDRSRERSRHGSRERRRSRERHDSKTRSREESQDRNSYKSKEREMENDEKIENTNENKVGNEGKEDGEVDSANETSLNFGNKSINEGPNEQIAIDTEN